MANSYIGWMHDEIVRNYIVRKSNGHLPGSQLTKYTTDHATARSPIRPISSYASSIAPTMATVSDNNMSDTSYPAPYHTFPDTLSRML